MSKVMLLRKKSKYALYWLRKGGKKIKIKIHLLAFPNFGSIYTKLRKEFTKREMGNRANRDGAMSRPTQ